MTGRAINDMGGETTNPSGSRGHREEGNLDSDPLFAPDISGSGGESAMGREAKSPSSSHPSSTDSAQPMAATGKSRSKLLPLIIVVAGLGFLALVVAGELPRLLQQQLLRENMKKQLAQAPPVSTIIAQPGSPTQEFILPGATEAIQDAPIYARVSGYLHKRYVNIGDKVHTGQVLADIDAPELDQQVLAAVSAEQQAQASYQSSKEALQKAEADVRTASANVQKAKTDLQYFTLQIERYKRLAKDGAVSTEDVDTHMQAYNAGVANLDATIAEKRSAEAALNSAKASVHVAEAAMNSAQALKRQIQATQSFKKVTALFDGTVVRRNVDAGVLISSGSAQGNSLLFEIAKTDVLRVFVYVPEQYVPFIHVEEKANLQFQEFPNRKFIGVVSNVSGGIDPSSRTLQVEIHVPNPKNELLPGMYAQVRFQCPDQIRLPIVPATTLQTRADGNFMYTVDGQNKVHVHKVTIGRDLGGQFDVASGIKSGDKVIVNPSDLLREGMSVTPTAQTRNNGSSG